MEENKQYPEGHFVGMWIGIGMAIFSALGIPLSIALNSPGFIGIGPGIGVAFGVAIGSSIEAKHKKEGKIRPLNEQEKKNRKTLVIVGVAILLLGAAALLFFLLNK